ncbi:hypothetical protein D3Z52_20775 [Clostridiaceae bacterium]|nr:hypothetical protein [Clostridiaceae bacterium]
MLIIHKNMAPCLCNAMKFLLAEKNGTDYIWRGRKGGLTPAPSDRPGPVNFPLHEKGKLNLTPADGPGELSSTENINNMHKNFS